MIPRAAFAVVLAVSLIGIVFYGQKTYRTYLLLQSAQELGVAEISSVRGWMTLRYIAETYGVSEAVLLQSLDIAGPNSANTALRDIAGSKDLAVFDYVVLVQRKLALLLERTVKDVPKADADTGFWNNITDWFMAKVLSYGLPVLLLADYLGSLGLPVPAGPVTAFAGSLAGSQHISAAGAFAIGVLGSWLGDLTAFGIGRLASPAWLDRWGPWLGLTAANRARVQTLFARWGGVTVIIGMSAVSQVSSVVGLLAGFSRFSLPLFLAYALVGRLLWTSGYFGLGLLAGSNFSAASGFLFSLGMLLMFALAGAASLYGLVRKPATA